MTPEQFDALVKLVRIIVETYGVPIPLGTVVSEVKRQRPNSGLPYCEKADVRKALQTLKSKGAITTTRGYSRGARRDWVAY